MNRTYGHALERARQKNQDILKPIIESLKSDSIRPLLKVFEDNRTSLPDEPVQQNYGPKPLQYQLVSAQAQNGNRPAPTQQGRGAGREFQESDADGHWVTIDHRHVFIHEGSRTNLARRSRIAGIAKKHEGDTSMPYTPGHPTCNLFVQRVIRESGAPNPLVKKADGTMGCPSAAEWAGSPVPGWRFLRPGETPQPGDVAAWPFHYSDATGHSGIVVAVDRNGHVTAIAAHEHEIGLDNSFNASPAHPKITFRRYTGE